MPAKTYTSWQRSIIIIIIIIIITIIIMIMRQVLGHPVCDRGAIPRK